MADRRLVDDLTIEEIEQVLRLRKRETRLQQFASHRLDMLPPEHRPEGLQAPHTSFLNSGLRWQERTLRDKLLLAIEVVAALGWLAC